MTQQGRQVVIVEAVRTPIGRGHREKGVFRDLHPATLLARTYAALVQRAGIDASQVDDVVTGCVQQFGEQGVNIGRTAWLQAGLPVETAATTIDRQCGSSQQAVNFATALIASGTHDCVVAAGVEHMGRIPLAAGPESRRVFGDPFTDQLLARHSLTDQGTAKSSPTTTKSLAQNSTSWRCARTGSPPARQTRATSRARSCRSRSTATRSRAIRGSDLTPRSRRSRSSLPPSRPEARSAPGTHRRSPTAPRRSCS
jgi:3-oxoacyl-[acyl-carrier-protein] synthase III